jgi:hypothetical protein
MSEQSSERRERVAVLEQTFRGMTFSEFRALSDDDEAELCARVAEAGIEQELARIGSGELDEGWFQESAERQLLVQWRYYRKYGVPDREVTDQDIEEYVEELFAYRREQDPSYGEHPKGYERLSHQQRKNFGFVVGYMINNTPKYEQWRESICNFIKLCL